MGLNSQDERVVKSLDNTIFELNSELNPLKLIGPSNGDEISNSLKTGKKTPKFQLPELPDKFDLQRFDRHLKNCSDNTGYLIDDIVKKLYSEKIHELAVLREIAEKRGSSDIIDLTAKIYSEPDNELVNRALELIRTEDSEVDTSPIPVTPERIRQELSDYLDTLGIKGWNVRLTSTSNTTVYSGLREIHIPKEQQGRFTQRYIEQMKVHEIGVHVFRAINGFSQPLGILGVGLPGYLSTEEGLASTVEQICGVCSHAQLQEYARRVIAVKSVYDRDNVKQTFERLRDECGSSIGDAVRLTIRAHRGGGFIKDHVYYKGFLELDRYRDQGGNLNKLCVGKIGLNHLRDVKKLQERSILQKPQFTLDSILQ